MKKRTLTEEIARMKTVMNVMGEVSDETYNDIQTNHSSSRLVMSKNDSIEFKPTPNQEISFKPKGLWYGIGDSWIKWVRSEMPDWEVDNVFKIDINESKILKVTNYKELVEFENKYAATREKDDNRSYSAMMSTRYKGIDWGAVAKDFAGIEIAPYIYEARYEHMWYYGWDVESGCIWGDGVITNITKLNKDSVDEMVTDTKVYCDECPHSWEIADGGDDLYICHECGHDNEPKVDEYTDPTQNISAMQIANGMMNENTFSGEMVWNHIKSITPNENDIPWGFKDKIKNAQFTNMSDFKLNTLLQTDPDFMEYYESGDVRYSDEDDIDPSDIDSEIVVVNGELLDGYSRAATLLRRGVETTNAFVGKSDGYDVKALDEYVRNIGDDKWRVYSEKGKNLGTYNSQADAKKRLQQVHYFKNK